MKSMNLIEMQKNYIQISLGEIKKIIIQINSMAEEQGLSQISMASTQLGKQQSRQRHSIVKNYYVSVILVLMGFYFLVFGIVQLVTNYQQNSVKKEFICTQYQCQIVFQKLSFQLDEDVHIYLENTAFTQYFLEPVNYNKETTIINCTDFLTNQEVFKDNSYSGATLNSQASAYPCGEIAMSYLEGDFVAKNNDNNQLLAINVDDLSNYQYGFINADLNVQWANVQNSRFQVWNQRNVARGIKKYWGYISEKIPQNLKIVLTTHNKIDQKLRSGLKIQLTNNKALSGYNIALTTFNFLQAVIVFFTSSLSFWIVGKRRNLQQKNSASHSNEDDRSIRSQAPEYSYTINP